MLKLYNRIWVDAIAAARHSNTESENWKIVTIIPMSALQAANLFTILYWLKVLVNRNLPLFVGFEIFSYRALNSFFIGVILTYVVPFVIINYLLIFSNDRYKILMTNYKDRSGKLYKKYVFITLGLALVPLILKVMFFS